MKQDCTREGRLTGLDSSSRGAPPPIHTSTEAPPKHYSFEPHATFTFNTEGLRTVIPGGTVTKKCQTWLRRWKKLSVRSGSLEMNGSWLTDADYTLNNPDTLTKYKFAAQISHKVLDAVTGKTSSTK